MAKVRTTVYTPKKASLSQWSWLVTGAVVCFPLSLHHQDYRGVISQGLSVSAHKSSPAYAAFEDLRENYKSEFPEIPEKAVELTSGHRWSVPAVEQAVGLHQVALRGLTIREPAVEPTVPAYVAATQVDRRRYSRSADLHDDSGQLLSLAERKRRLYDELKDEDWSAPTPASRARELVEQELMAKRVVEKTLLSKSGSPIYIRSTRDPSIHEMAANPSADSASFAAASATVLAERPLLPANLRPLWLAGQVEMTGGLAFMGPQSQMVIKRVFNGQTFEQGRIWVTEGKFEIRVHQATGFLVAELVSDGRVMGHGELSLLELESIPDKSDHINDIRIALRPTTEGASFSTISGYSHDLQKISVKGARVEIQAYTDSQKVNDEGAVSEPTLSRESSFVARATAPGHWPSLVVGQAQEPQDIRLFANPMMEALINLNLAGQDRKEAYNMSVVWGRLTQNGKPLADGQVEMAGSYQPVYLNDSYLPDPNLQATSKNGLFAFLRVRPGVQALRARINNKFFPAQIFPTESKHVSYVEIEVRDKVVSQFRVFDGLNMNKPVSASIRLVGSEDSLSVGQGKFVQYSTAANPFMVEADGGVEYEPSRVTVTGQPHVVNVPLVQREWLYNLAAQKSLAQQPDCGIIVGYMDMQDFEVELTGYNAGETMQIVYFDSMGRPVDGNHGIAGGGFVVFNAPRGLQTLYVHPTQSRETFSQIVVAEPEFVQVIAH
jgi:hypothetical protein